MKSHAQYIAERRQIAGLLEDFNSAACRHFAELLRKHDQYERLPVAYLDAVYRLLSFGRKQDRAVLMLGTADQIESLISAVQQTKGFYSDTGFWMDL